MGWEWEMWNIQMRWRPDEARFRCCSSLFRVSSFDVSSSPVSSDQQRSEQYSAPLPPTTSLTGWQPWRARATGVWAPWLRRKSSSAYWTSSRGSKERATLTWSLRLLQVSCDICAMSQTHAYVFWLMIYFAPWADFQRLDKAADDARVPESLHMLLTHLNGGIYFMEKEAMSAERIVKVLAKCSVSKRWDPMFLPFCGDEDDMLVIDSSSGRIFEWDSHEGWLGIFLKFIFSLSDIPICCCN